MAQLLIKNESFSATFWNTQSCWPCNRKTNTRSNEVSPPSALSTLNLDSKYNIDMNLRFSLEVNPTVRLFFSFSVATWPQTRLLLLCWLWTFCTYWWRIAWLISTASWSFCQSLFASFPSLHFAHNWNNIWWWVPTTWWVCSGRSCTNALVVMCERFLLGPCLRSQSSCFSVHLFLELAPWNCAIEHRWLRFIGLQDLEGCFGHEDFDVSAGRGMIVGDFALS